MEFDPQSDAFTRDPYSTYAALRALDEPFYFEAADVWLLSRFDEVDEAARNAALVRSYAPYLSASENIDLQRQANFHEMPNHERFVQSSMLESDGEMHSRLRLLILREFSRRFVEQQREMIQRFVDGLLEQLIDEQEFDFVTQLASHVPGHIIGRILGVPDEDCPQLRTWSENIVQYFDVGRTPARKQLAEQATTEFYEYLLALIEYRKAKPAADLTSTLVAAMQAGELDESELISTCMLLLAAGHGSTIDVLGSGMHALLKHPDQMQRLEREPALIHTAVQEMFRFDSPLPFFHRFASEPVTFRGRPFPAGTKFGLLYGSANRDPEVFANADDFDIARTPNRHIAFGRGAHLCLGNHLSRLDMEVIFLTLTQRLKQVELIDSDPTYKTSLSARGPESLRLRITAR